MTDSNADPDPGRDGDQDSKKDGDLDADREQVTDAVDRLLGTLEDHDDVAFAEVGGVVRESTDLVVTEDGPRNVTRVPITGVWCRAFANGSAAYRFTTDLSSENLENVVERVVAGGKYLAQELPSYVDVASEHRGVHRGWASDPVDAVSDDHKRDAVVSALDAVEEASIDFDRLRANYADEHVELSVATTAGSVVHTTVDRASLDLTLATTAGPTVRRHEGSTRGAAFLDRVEGFVDDAVRDAGEVADATGSKENAPPGEPSGAATVVLSPTAAGQLVHHLASYLAADNAMFGFSPFEPGDTIAPETLTIDDGVHAGSWAARAYDAEARPTTPVRLVDRGTVETFLHDVVTGAEADVVPAGTTVPSIGFEAAPRIHHRHLDVHPGDQKRDALLADADVYVRRFDEPWHRDEFERTQRSGEMPPSPLYARDIAEKMGERTHAGEFELPAAEAFRVENGEVGAAVSPTLEWTPETLTDLSGVGQVREEYTGVATKHKSRIPFAVTAPSLQFEATLK